MYIRIQGLPHSSVEEAEHPRVRELIYRIENHPHRDDLQANLMQDNVYNPCSESSQKMIHDMVKVKYFELCETISKAQCSYCLLFRTNGIVYCTCGNCLCNTDSTRQLNRTRFDALSISNYVIKKGCPHGSRYGNAEKQTLYRTAYNAWKRCRKKKDSTSQTYTGTLDRFLKSPRYRESQEAHGWDEANCAAHDKLAQEDHSFPPTRSEHLEHSSNGSSSSKAPDTTEGWLQDPTIEQQFN